MALSVPESSVTGGTQYPEAKATWHGINNSLAVWPQDAQSPVFVDTSKLIPFDHASCARGLWHPDNLHFTAAGSKEFGSRLAPIVAEFLCRKLSLSRNLSFPCPPTTPQKSSAKIIRSRNLSCRPTTPEKRRAEIAVTDSAKNISVSGGMQNTKAVQKSHLNLFVPHIPVSIWVGGM